ncbi:MAG: RNB domain-containing ribonuclease, partial [Actinomycetota bacterium]|nr:RNB domain-containing ribonuclease [Actinomycetota bacterium]
MIVAQLSRRGRFWTGEPFFERGRRVVVERDKRLKEGALALLRTTGTGRGQAKVVKLIGRADVARDVIEALMLDRGLRRRFDPDLEARAREAEPVDVERRDLRERVTFTIDPASAKDFDDAISAERLGEGAWRVWVHIADVTAFVPPGSRIDKEAYRRATSVYVPGAVEPMLPTALSNEKCSLVPFADRLTVTVEMEVRGPPTPKVVKTAFYRSVIRSDERLDYD